MPPRTNSFASSDHFRNGVCKASGIRPFFLLDFVPLSLFKKKSEAEYSYVCDSWNDCAPVLKAGRESGDASLLPAFLDSALPGGRWCCAFPLLFPAAAGVHVNPEHASWVLESCSELVLVLCIIHVINKQICRTLVTKQMAASVRRVLLHRCKKPSTRQRLGIILDPFSPLCSFKDSGFKGSLST